ncbi:peptidoglycan editing factor PgeF [candidate division TA06 bacterium]|nr:peptidoglycan editing factor PgeF [candidate division TA06 bacterium]
MIWQKEKKNGLTFLRYDGWPGVSCFVSTRIGGVSPPPYESLNMGFSSGDRRENVAQNRDRFYQALGINPSRVIIPGQVHGKEVFSYKSPITNHESPICDGLITQTSGLVLGMTIADCLALFLYDPRKRVVGLLHSGWRGVHQGIVNEALRKMNREFGSEPEDCEVHMSPAIGPCCYEVGEEVIQSFHKVAPEALEKRDSRVFLNLGKAVEIQLLKEGIKKINPPEADRICTACREKEFFSYRRERGMTGRMVAVMWIRSK